MISHDTEKKKEEEEDFEMLELRKGLSLSPHINGTSNKRIKREPPKPRSNSLHTMRTTHSSDIPTPLYSSGHWAQLWHKMVYTKPKRPNKDVHIPQYRPIFVYIITALNVVVFIVSLGVGNWKVNPKENPLIGPPLDVLVAMGAKDTEKILNGDWFRLFVPMFLHGGVIHLVLNMFVFYRVGSSMEIYFGGLRIAPIYFLSGLSATLMSAIFLPDVISVGASGAIYGMIGSLFGDFILYHKLIPKPRRYFLYLLISALLGLIIGLYPLMDNFAHIGGLIGGILSSLVFLSGKETNSQGHSSQPTCDCAAKCIGGVLLFGWLLTTFVVLYTDIRSEGWCENCYRMSCVDTRWWDCERTCTTEIVFPNGTRVCE